MLLLLIIVIINVTRLHTVGGLKLKAVLTPLSSAGITYMSHHALF